MTEYFDNRAAAYLKALSLYPTVLAQEYQTAVKMCDLREGDILLTIPSSCEQITPYLTSDVTLVQFETNRELASLSGIQHCSWENIPYPTASVDRILSLASLHHCDVAQRRAFYAECKRLLKPGGRLIIGDVAAGSQLADWLNVFVNEHNPFGHCGQFFSALDAELLEDCGFAVDIQATRYPWVFTDKEAMLDFTRRLFMLECSEEEILSGLTKYLACSDNYYQMGLMYFRCSVP